MGSTITSFLWKSLEQYGVMLVQFCVQIVLARILTPEDYGVIAILMGFSYISMVLINGGFPVALVQASQISKKGVSSVFYFSLFVGTSFYLGWFVSAPFIDNFFSVNNLSLYIRVMMLSIFPSVYSSVQIAMLRRDMNFRPQAFANILAVCTSGVLALVAAYLGAGVWALILQHLVYTISLPLFISFRYRLKLLWSFSTKELKRLISFGWKVLAFEMTDAVFVQIRTMVIGKMYSSADLAYYDRGKQFPFLVIKGINGALQAVLLPKMSSLQDDNDKVLFFMRRSIVLSSFCIFPILAFLFAIAPELINLLLTEKWLSAVPFLRIFVVVFAVWPLSTSILQALYALGKSGSVFIFQLIRRACDLLVLLYTYKMGVYAIAGGEVIIGIFSLLILAIPSFLFLRYTIWQQIRDVGASLLLSLVFWPVCKIFKCFSFPPLFYIVGVLFFGGGAYILLAYSLRLEGWKIFKAVASNIFYRK